MSRFVSLAALVVTLGATGGFTNKQDRPNFSGKWTIVAERSTPAGSLGAFGESFTVTQQANTLQTEMTVMAVKMVAAAGQPEPVERTPMTLTESYTTDGTEHEMPAMEGRAGATVMLASKRHYRAIWTTGQLVIVTFTKAAVTRDNIVEGQITATVRTAFSLDAEGSLIVDRIAISTPRVGGPMQQPPVATRSVYKKSQ